MVERNRADGQGNESKSDREQCVCGLTASLDECCAQFERLKMSLPKSRAASIEEQLEMERELELKIQNAREKISEIGKGTDETWHNLKDSAEAILADLRTNLEKARKIYHIQEDE